MYVDSSDSALEEVCSESDRSTLVVPRTARLVNSKGAQFERRTHQTLAGCTNDKRLKDALLTQVPIIDRRCSEIGVGPRIIFLWGPISLPHRRRRSVHSSQTVHNSIRAEKHEVLRRCDSCLVNFNARNVPGVRERDVVPSTVRRLEGGRTSESGVPCQTDAGERGA